jgi:hypothetical protein
MQRVNAAFLSNDQEELTFLDVDRKAEETLKYADGRTIKDAQSKLALI